jgi:hypothetical protein
MITAALVALPDALLQAVAEMTAQAAAAHQTVSPASDANTPNIESRT